MDFVKKNAKALVTFVIAALINSVNDVINGRQPFPTTWGEWGRYLGTSVASAVIVWATSNKLDLGQLLSGMRKLAPAEQATVAKETLKELPNPVSDAVVHDYPSWTA